MKKIIYLLLLTVLIACSNKKNTAENEVVEWSEFMTPSMPIYSQMKVVYDEYLKNKPLTLPFSADKGPALYRERAQRYFLQGKSGVPDLLDSTLEQIYSYAASGMAYPLNDLFNKDPEKDLIEPALIESLTIDGNIYALPNSANVRLLIYRKDLLAKYNLNVPATWADLINVAKTIKEKEGINGFMFTTQSKEVRAFQEFMRFYFTLADGIYEVKDGKATYIADKANFEKVLQLYKDLFAAAIDPNSKGQDFKAVDYGITGGQVAMVTDGPWIWEHMTEDPARGTIISNLGVAPIPVPAAGQPSGTYMEVKGYVINPYSAQEKRQNVYNAVKMLVDKPFIELEVKYSSAPSIRSDIKSETEFGQAFSDNLDTGKVLEFINWDIPQNYIIDAIQSVIYERATPEEAANTLDKQLKDYESQAVVKQGN